MEVEEQHLAVAAGEPAQRLGRAGGVAVDRHGRVYVANWSILPANGSPDAPPGARGQVVRLGR